MNSTSHENKEIKIKKTFFCNRCGRELTSKESIERGYGSTCYKIVQLQNNNNQSEISSDLLQELVNRVRKLELDNSFLKHQLKHKTYGNIPVEAIERIKQDEHRPERNEMKIQFNAVVKEMKIVFHEDFDYHEILQPIEPLNEPIMIENLEMIMEEVN